MIQESGIKLKVNTGARLQGLKRIYIFLLMRPRDINAANNPFFTESHVQQLSVKIVVTVNTYLIQ